MDLNGGGSHGDEGGSLLMVTRWRFSFLEENDFVSVMEL